MRFYELRRDENRKKDVLIKKKASDISLKDKDK